MAKNSICSRNAPPRGRCPVALVGCRPCRGARQSNQACLPCVAKHKIASHGDGGAAKAATQSVARRRSDSRLAAKASPGDSEANVLSSMGTASENSGARMTRSRSSTAMWCVSRSESLVSEASMRDLSSAIAAFFDSVAPGAGGGASPPAASGVDGGCAVLGDLGWGLGPD
ncbi:hypothetical protein EJB05_06951, partial [Eragrostis curvula]